jgi:transposase
MGWSGRAPAPPVIEAGSGQRRRAELPGILATQTDVLSPRMLCILEDLSADWRRLHARIEGLSDEIEALAHEDQHCEGLMTVPGIGPI